MHGQLARTITLGVLFAFAACKGGGEGASTKEQAPVEAVAAPTPTEPTPTPAPVGGCKDVKENDGIAACEAACSAGDAKACGIAGQMHLTDDDEAVADANAAPLLTKACDGDDGAGCQWLAAFHANGLGGIAKDEAKAAEIRTKACALGAKAACPKTTP